MMHFTSDTGRVPTRIAERMRDRQQSFATLAPISIFPLDIEDICDLLLGTLVFNTLLSVSSVARRLADAGYRVTPYEPPESGDAFMTVERSWAANASAAPSLHTSAK